MGKITAFLLFCLLVVSLHLTIVPRARAQGSCVFYPGSGIVRVDRCDPGFNPTLTGATGECECRPRPVTKGGARRNQPAPKNQNNFNPVTTCQGQRGIDTAIGCIPIENTGDTITWFLGWFIGISGGIAFLLIVFSGFQMMTASGDPQKLQNGREMLTAAVSGLILIIFSVFLLDLIGVKILQLPGF